MAETWELRARFARSLSQMYAGEVPAYSTLVDVTSAVNADYTRDHPAAAERLGSTDRVTAERHGAIRVGTPAELRDVARLFAAFGMAPVGFYDLRTASPPVPVVSTAFRPTDPNELARNPFRVFASMLAVDDRRFFTADLAARLSEFLSRRTLFAPHLSALADRAAAAGGLPDPDAAELVRDATAAFELSPEPIDHAWYTELARVSDVAADIGGVGSTHINHLTPRVLDIDALYRRMTERGIAMIDKIQGPPRLRGPDVLLRQTSFRALAEPRRFTHSDGTVRAGTLRVRFGEVEARGVALTPAGRARYDDLMAASADEQEWHAAFPATEADLHDSGLAYFEYTVDDGRITPRPIVYEDFLPASAAGIFQSNLTTAGGSVSGDAAVPTYGPEWLSGVLGMPVHDPYELYFAQQERSRAAVASTGTAATMKEVR